MQCSSFYTVRAHKLRHSHLNFSTHSEAEQQARRASTQSSSEMSCWPHSSSSDLTSFKFAPEIPKFSFVLSFSFSKKRRVPMSLPRCRSKCSPPVLVAALYSSEHPRRAHPLRWRGGRVRVKEGEEEEGLQQSPQSKDALNYQHKAFKMTKEPLPTSFYTLYFSGFQHRGLELSRRPGDKCEGPRLVKEGKKV